MVFRYIVLAVHNPTAHSKSCVLLAWYVSCGYTVAFQISVHIRVFILRKNTGLYGLIWVYTLTKYMAMSPYTLCSKSIRHFWKESLPRNQFFQDKSTLHRHPIGAQSSGPAVARSPYMPYAPTSHVH